VSRDDTGAQVRQVSTRDWRLWRGLRLAALADTPGAFCRTLAEMSGPSDSEPTWRRRLADTPWPVVAVVDGAAAGLAAGFWHPPPHGPDVELASLWVAPDSRRRRVAAALVTEVVRWAAEQGAGRVVLSVFDDNDAATDLYRGCGFAVTGVATDSSEGRRMLQMAVAVAAAH
jgi:ribosomal protein S18 acetylase RimI-like enzyme